MAQERRFLDVDQSFTGRAWTNPLVGDDLRLVAALSEEAGVPEIVGRILARQAIEPGHATAYLDPKLRDTLPDPRTLAGMDAVAGRLVKAIETRETVALFGDYDVDGACSVALMARFLRHFG
ncbi:MAG: single-stranded-DNA-specific exonuclease RecJ, partial [Pseudomonadota bacterium]